MEENEKNEHKKKRFNLFDWYYREGKESNKSDINALKDPSLINCLKIIWKKLGKLFTTNMLFIFCNFPIIFLLIAMSGILSKTSVAPLYQSWGPLQGAFLYEQVPETTKSSLTAIFGIQTEISVINTPTIVFFCLGLLVIFTLGFTKVGTTYIYRNLMSGEPVFTVSDFFYIIKKNIKQSLIFGIIDALILLMFGFNIYFLFANYNAAQFNSFMLFLTIAMLIVYSFARTYAYIMIFTFDLKMTKIIKYSLYYVILGIKRNCMSLLATVLILAINYTLFVVFTPLGLLLPFVITFALCDFIAVYTAYPNVIKYLMTEQDAQSLINKRTSVANDDYTEE